MYSYNSIEELSDCYHLPGASDQKMAYIKCLSFLNHESLNPTVRLFYSYIYAQCTYHHTLMRKGKLDKEQVLSSDQFYLVMSQHDIATMLSISESSSSNLIHEMLHLGLLEKDGTVQKKAKYLVNFPLLESDGSLIFTETTELEQNMIRSLKSKRGARVASHPRLECSPLTTLNLRSDYTYSVIPEPVLARSDLSPLEVIVLSCFEKSRLMSSKNAWVEEGGLLYVRRNLNTLAEELCLTPDRVTKAVERLVSKGYVYATLEDNGSQKFYLVNLYKKHPEGIDFRSVLLKNVSCMQKKSAKNIFFSAKTQDRSLQKNESILLKRKIYINQYLESLSLDEMENIDDDILYKKAEEKADVQLSIDQKVNSIKKGNLDLTGQTFDQLYEEFKIHLSFDEAAVKYVDADAAKAVLTECVRILQDGSDSDLMLFILGMDQRSFVELCFRFDQALKNNAAKGTPIRYKRAYIKKLVQNLPDIEIDLLHSEQESSAKESVYMERLYDCQESPDTTLNSCRTGSYDYDDISRDEALNTLDSTIRKNDTEQLWTHSVLISNSDPSSRKSTHLKRWVSALEKSGVGARLISGAQESRILSRSLSQKKTYEDLISELSSEKVLIIDDLGMEHYDLFEKVLTNRLQDPEKYTLIATRLRPEEIQLRYHPRTVSRIFGGIVTR